MFGKKLKNVLIGSAILASVAALPANATPITTDIITVVDESGSMGGEHAWISGMIADLDSALSTTAGADPYSAQFGLTGFGGSGAHRPGHKHTVGGFDFGTATEFGTATGTLTTSGSTEDGYDGIDTALNDYTLRANAVTNLILVTDEDRDILNGGLNLTNITASLNSANALLNAVVNASFRCADNSVALGVAAGGVGYKADGLGGFSTCAGATTLSGAGSTIADYVNLALGTGGAAWDLNQLRTGGMTATSFTAAFVDVKVQETITHTVPEPGALALFGLGLAGVGFSRRRKAKV